MTARTVPIVLLTLLTTGSVSVFAQSELIDQKLAKQLGAGYAAMINFSENPDIATARYYINEDSGGDPVLHVTRLSGERRIHLKNHNSEPFVQIHVPYQTFKAQFEFGTNGNINTEWRALGATLTTGIRIPVSTNLSVNPAVSAGYVRLENKADYSGDAAALDPLFKGIIFDWASDAWLAGVSLAMEYERKYQAFDLNLHARASHNLIETFHTSEGFVQFSSYATTLSVRGETVHPTSLQPMGYPLAVVTMLGGTSFVGPYRDELGFAYFFDGGLAIETDISRLDWPVRKLRLGAKGIYGEDVYGWSAIFSWKF